MFVMLILAIAFSLVARNLLSGWFYQVLFFLLGAAIPIIDVPYVKYLHNSYCEGNIGLQVYKKIEPQESYYIESTSRISLYDFFSEKIKFIEYYDPRKKELWKVTKVDNELVKEPINEVSSTYQFVDQGRVYPVDYAVKRVISRQIAEIESSAVAAEFIQYTNTKPLGWFFDWYYGTRKDCELKSLSSQIIISLKNLIVNGTEF
tara:strand:- start:1020 stop:1631 length:612 start_codon:yes stop_codon:yes gene_type:complete